jgi:hypothetical protein
MEPFDISKEIGNTAWIDALGMECAVSKQIFQENLKKFSDDANTLTKRQATIRALRENRLAFTQTNPKLLMEIDTLFQELKEVESELEEFESAPKEWEKEGKSQILFTQEWAKPFNHIPFLLPAAAIFKIYIFPFFAVVLPLLAWILPYVVVRFFFGMNMPFETYKIMMMNMWLGGKSWVSMGFWEQMRVVFQTAWTAFGIFQGMYQPVQQALHTKGIDDTIVKHGYLLQAFVEKVKRLHQCLSEIKGKPIENPMVDAIPIEEPRQTYAHVRDYPKDIQWIWRKLGEYEIEWRLAGALEMNFVKFDDSKNVSLEMTDFFDPSIAPELCVPSSIALNKKSTHSILTGPNKGGKSSSLRALCLNVWLAQTFGLVFAKSAKIRPFAWIQSGLRLADSPGTESMFEKEILFGVSTLRLAKSGRPGIVFYDECFHSTNPPDGEKTARIFLETLWTHSNVVSVVSTHIFSLVENAPAGIQRLCVPAEKTPTGIVYSFQLAPGICKVSSVEEIYKKFGFPLLLPRSNLKGNLVDSNRTVNERIK